MGPLELMKTWWNRSGSRCPDEAALAAYAEGYRDGIGRAALEAHLANCVACRNQIAFLARDENPGSLNMVPERLLARARELVSHPSVAPKGLWWAAAATAATACVIVVTALRMLPPTVPVALRPPAGPAIKQEASPMPKADAEAIPAPAVRAATRLARSPDLVQPSEGATVGEEQLEFRWRPLPRCLFYELQVTTRDGELLWKERTESTHLRLPKAVSLRPGEQYFAWVVAHMREGNTVKAHAVSFKVENLKE